MPSVAKTRKPSPWNRRTIGTTFALSWSLTVTKIEPESGSAPSTEICALAKAIPNESAMPITSPVDRISGPRMRSTPCSLLKGNTASLTATYGWSTSSCRPRSSSVAPVMIAAARLASGTPVVFETNGTVREPRGFTSST